MKLLTILNKALTLSVPDDKTILESSIEQGVDYPFGCHSGLCGACKSHLVSGEVRLTEFSPFALSEAERAGGMILACRALPVSDCIVLYDDDPDAPNHKLCRRPARVVAREMATHDIAVIHLAVEGEFAFSAGQFASLAFPGLPARDYSMASRPDEAEIVFHIRRVFGGKVSEAVHAADIVGRTLSVSGPYGTSYLRQRHTGPMLLVAGGSGLAPILSILETALRAGMRQRMALYFGVRAERDLYAMDRLQDLARAHANLAFVPVLSQPEEASAHRTGFLADAVGADFTDLSGWKAYLAGPPIMVETVASAMEKRGLGAANRHADPFYTSADKPGRQAP
jgi:CDP-4-dehydro-6-deoxyglucose reductase/ferredoxin-NAD(P)+ reductase (naphthalene dioxygenase ferredoxin-specific)